MTARKLEPLGPKAIQQRQQQCEQIARRFGFRGSVEYRHVRSGSGGAQYGVGRSADRDLLVVYAEAFERNRDPADFDLDAIIAHECGHQILERHPTLAKALGSSGDERLDEVLASVIGSLLLTDGIQAESLVAKATVELAEWGATPESAVQYIEQLRAILRSIL